MVEGAFCNLLKKKNTAKRDFLKKSCDKNHTELRRKISSELIKHRNVNLLKCQCENSTHLISGFRNSKKG